jgi:hypothetical protein
MQKNVKKKNYSIFDFINMIMHMCTSTYIFLQYCGNIIELFFDTELISFKLQDIDDLDGLNCHVKSFSAKLFA